MGQSDTQRTESLARYLDAHPVRTNPFGDNRAGDRAYRRVERIVAALFLLTNHISEREAVRGEVRTIATQILGHALALRDAMRSPQSHALVSLQAEVRRLISLCRILAIAGYISLQNADTVIDALDELGLFLASSQNSILAERMILTREDLSDVHTGMTRPIPKPAVKDKGNIKDIRISDIQETRMDSRESGSLSARASSILEILRTGGTLGIREICANLPEYSEKMVQRELQVLVEGGSVRKMGLKRWSRYALVQP